MLYSASSSTEFSVNCESALDLGLKGDPPDDPDLFEPLVLGLLPLFANSDPSAIDRALLLALGLLIWNEGFL